MVGEQVMQFAIDVSQVNYVHKIKPTPVEKSRRAEGSETCNLSEKTVSFAGRCDPMASSSANDLCFRDDVLLAGKRRNIQLLIIFFEKTV